MEKEFELESNYIKSDLIINSVDIKEQAVQFAKVLANHVLLDERSFTVFEPIVLNLIKSPEVNHSFGRIVKIGSSYKSVQISVEKCSTTVPGQCKFIYIINSTNASGDFAAIQALERKSLDSTSKFFLLEK